MTNISRRDAIKFSAVSALGGVALGAALPRISGQSDVEKCIEAHKVASGEYDAALEHKAEIDDVFAAIEDQRPLFRITPEDAAPIAYDTSITSPSNLTKHIIAHYADMRSNLFMLPAQSQAKMLAKVNDWESDALKRVEKFEDQCRADVINCGLADADDRVEAAQRAEDEALLALLASYPETPEDEALKGDYLRTAWHELQTETGVFEIKERHMSALFQGMGCGELS